LPQPHACLIERFDKFVRFAAEAADAAKARKRGGMEQDAGRTRKCHDFLPDYVS
jgi:hypothetical protein